MMLIGVALAVTLAAFEMPLDNDLTPWLPPLSDIKRFPCAAIASDQVQRYSNHIAHLEHSKSLPILDSRFGQDWHIRCITEARKRLFIWEMLFASHEDLWLGIPPRAILDMLRNVLGPLDYEIGCMPLEIPEIDYGPQPIDPHYTGNNKG